MMKKKQKAGAKTYSFLILIVFIRNIDKERIPSVQDLVNVTDELANKFGISVDITLQTKYAVIRELIHSGLLANDSHTGYHSISLSNGLKEYLFENIDFIIRD